MKTIKISLVACAVFLMAACSEKEAEEQCTDASQTCTNNSSVSIDATSCSNGEDVYYLIDGQQYTYDQLENLISTTCNAGSSALINDQGIAQMQARMAEISSRLLVEARAASGCDY